MLPILMDNYTIIDLDNIDCIHKNEMNLANTNNYISIRFKNTEKDSIFYYRSDEECSTVFSRLVSLLNLR